MDKKYNSGQWSQARYNSFIKSALRSASVRWPPRYTVLNEAFVEKGINPATGRVAKLFRCKCCGSLFPQSQIDINHIEPVVPIAGFDSWDGVIKRMFCEKEGMEALCQPCHKKITKEENSSRKGYKYNAKE